MSKPAKSGATGKPASGTGSKEPSANWLQRTLESNALWFALGLVIVVAGGTYVAMEALEARVDRRLGERLQSREVTEVIDKRIDYKIVLVFNDRPEFSRQLTDSGYVLFTQAIEREFVELIANLGSIEANTQFKNEVRRIIDEYRANLDRLEQKIPPGSQQQTKYLLNGFLSIADGQYKKAILTLEQYSNSKELIAKYYLMGVAYALDKDNANAAKFYSRVLEQTAVKSPDVRLSAKAKSNLGNAALRRNDYAAAIRLHKEALNIDPTLHGIYVNLAEATLRLAENDKLDLAVQQGVALGYLCKATISIPADAIVASVLKHQDGEKRKRLVDLFGSERAIRAHLTTECTH
jgi:tetratricopeptide (TPR) repeat protein